MSHPISIVGTIATDPKFSRETARVPLCSFRVASNERRYDKEKGEWIDSPTNWFTVTAFRGLAEHAHQSFSKGERVIVMGRLRIRQWKENEKSGTTAEIDADALGHDLRFGFSSFTKVTGASASTPEAYTSATAWREEETSDSKSIDQAARNKADGHQGWNFSQAVSTDASQGLNETKATSEAA